MLRGIAFKKMMRPLVTRTFASKAKKEVVTEDQEEEEEEEEHTSLANPKFNSPSSTLKSAVVQVKGVPHVQVSKSNGTVVGVHKLNFGVTQPELMSASSSNWTVEHVANAGCVWDPSFNTFNAANPALLYGDEFSQDELRKDKTLEDSTKRFLDGVWSRKGPDCEFPEDYINSHKSFDIIFVSLELGRVITGLRMLCTSPNEPVVRSVFANILKGLGFDNAAYNLYFQEETPLRVQLNNTILSSKPECWVSKLEPQRFAPTIRALQTEVKPGGQGNRQRGSGQLFSEIMTAAVWNYISTKKTFPLIGFSMIGPYLRFVSATFPLPYVHGLRSESLVGTLERPVFGVWPKYNSEVATQGYNLLTTAGRSDAIFALIHLKHNLVPSVSLKL